MGCGTEVICKTCRLRWYCGYGSYSSYHERAARAPLQEHEGHDIYKISEDYTSVENGNLMVDGQYGSELAIEGYESFPLIDVDPYRDG